MSKREQQMIAFASLVLETLATNKEWGADTLEEIGEHALHCEVAKHDDEGNFERVA